MTDCHSVTSLALATEMVSILVVAIQPTVHGSVHLIHFELANA